MAELSGWRSENGREKDRKKEKETKKLVVDTVVVHFLAS